MPAPPPPLLLTDRGCPFAHRVLALLHHLGVAHDVHEAPAGHHPPELARYSSSGRIPLLVDGAITLSETGIMLEHLAEAHGFAAAYPAALTARTLHRHAMALMDVVVAPRLHRVDDDLDHARLAECLDVFADLTRTTPVEPSLLAFHFAPIWLRFRWWWPEAAVTRAIEHRRALADWLDRAAAIPAVADTAPDRAENVRAFHATCALHARR